jgi:hypothetical protein
MIKYATEQAKLKQAERIQERKATLDERVPAFPDIDSLDEDALKQLCRDLHSKFTSKIYVWYFASRKLSQKCIQYVKFCSRKKS